MNSLLQTSALAVACLSLSSLSPASPQVQPAKAVMPKLTEPAWNARNVEHLLNRAAFGGASAEIEAALTMSPSEFVDQLMTPKQEWTRLHPELVVWLEQDEIDRLGLSRDVVKRERSRIRETDRGQFLNYAEQWYAAMVDHDDPVRDHMTLFWHGLFTTSFKVVRRKFELINQHQFYRYNALESYSDMLRGLVREPAMIQYLDNNTNVVGHPNENLARELMELFSLGEGNYSEEDVREAARALTGYHCNDYGAFAFYEELHDNTEKSILGVTGNLDADDVVKILLDQPACANYIAGCMLEYFEGVEPSEARLEKYASLLRDGDYEIKPVLRTLFLDPEFYRDEVIGARVQGPIEWTIALLRKLELEPPPYFAYKATETMGQCFYQPPTVEGWDDGEAWITNDTLMQRGNCVGLLLDAFNLSDASGMMEVDDLSTLSQAERRALFGRRAMDNTIHELSRLVLLAGWEPETTLVARLNAAGAKTDAEVVDYLTRELLAIEPPASSSSVLMNFLARERESQQLGDTPLMEADPAALDFVLRRLAHLLYSLPEAQLG